MKKNLKVLRLNSWVEIEPNQMLKIFYLRFQTQINYQDLVTKVFPRMAVDNISFVAKSDEFIKALGSRYLKIHKEKHLFHVVIQKLRTVARLLI